jgi:hypothetical protein
MLILSNYKGTIFYIVPLPFVAIGRCETCQSPVLLLGLYIGNRIFTLQIHFEK